eukprot:GEMP01080959.1.p1 GENE.GEMP01080959.1~~GEMP01080959.1.p1  ORF type:complete len:214 (+),score=39.68 GEMP01080959.1:110-751(+)
MPDLLSILGASTLTKDGLKPTVFIRGIFDISCSASVLGVFYTQDFYTQRFPSSSASWCAPCRRYTPKLVEAYTKIYEEKDMAIIFLSGDRDEAAFDTFYGGMPWCAMPFSERGLFNEARTSYEVVGIPKLIILSPDGRLLSKDGKAKINEPDDFPWISSPEEPGPRAPPRRPGRKVPSRSIPGPSGRPRRKVPSRSIPGPPGRPWRKVSSSCK